MRGGFTPDTHKVMVQVQVNGVVTITKRVGWVGGDPVFRQFSYKWLPIHKHDDVIESLPKKKFF